MTAYYNEIDPFAARWLRNLIAAGHIAAGEVDERSIAEVRPDDLKGFAQCHFFAGIAGWSLALRLAGFPDDRPVWTGSCPCQPFSAAGKGKAADDERHLWPAWFSLIRECKPAIVFGEQVEAAIGWGWLDAVFADLEGQGYACGAAVLPACGVGAPHIRQRVWFVADASSVRRGESQHAGNLSRTATAQSKHEPIGDAASIVCGIATRELAHPNGGHPGTEGLQRSGQHGLVAQDGGAGGVGDAEVCRSGAHGRQPSALSERAREARRSSAWSDCDWLPCTDGKARPVEPGTFPLAHGIPGRVGRLRAYGNAITPQVAAEFIRAAA